MCMGCAAMCARKAWPSGIVCGLVLDSGKLIASTAIDVAPTEIEHFAATVSGVRKQADGGLEPLGNL